MKKLIMLAIAAMALAVPTFASAGALDDSHFLHEGLPIEHNEEVPIILEGTAGFESPAGSIHCEEITVTVDLETTGTGTVTEFDTHNCKANGVFPTHATAEELHAPGMWEVETMHDAATGAELITIDEVTIHNSVRHPETTHLEIGTNTVEGKVTATLIGPSTVDLGNEPGDVILTSEGQQAPISLDGHLTVTDHEGNHTEIGVATTE